jgi:hypothetical protein
VLCFCFVCIRLVRPVLPVSLDCSFLIAPSSCVPSVASFSGLFIPDCSFGFLKRLFAAATVWSLAGDAFFSFDSAFRLLEFG